MIRGIGKLGDLRLVKRSELKVSVGLGSCKMTEEFKKVLSETSDYNRTRKV